MKTLALIPARGRSKGIPRKNIRPFGGVPLIAWSIAAARASRVDRVLVSTDDPEIREVALAWGAEAPFLRPAELAADDTTDLPVFHHALDWLELAERWIPDVVVHLRPTSPVRPEGLVDLGLERLAAVPEADSLRAVAAPQQNPYKMWARQGPWLRPLLECPLPEPWNQPRQALPACLWQTGHLDVVRRATLARGSMTGRRILGLEVAAALAVDLDTEEQWAVAELALEHPGLVRPAPVAA